MPHTDSGQVLGDLKQAIQWEHAPPVVPASLPTFQLGLEALLASHASSLASMASTMDASSSVGTQGSFTGAASTLSTCQHEQLKDQQMLMRAVTLSTGVQVSMASTMDIVSTIGTHGFSTGPARHPPGTRWESSSTCRHAAARQPTGHRPAVQW